MLNIKNATVGALSYFCFVETGLSECKAVTPLQFELWICQYLFSPRLRVAELENDVFTIHASIKASNLSV